MKRLIATIRGRVQGVSFRYYTREEALRLNVTGWVRNERDGSVHVVAEGSEENLRKLLGYLQRGPRSAKVDEIDSEWGHARQAFQTFEIRW